MYLIGAALLALGVLIVIWLNNVYDDKMRALESQTNAAFFQSLEDAENQLVLRKSIHRKTISSDTLTIDYKDTTEIQGFVVMEFSNDSSLFNNEFRIRDLLGFDHHNLDTTRTITVSISGESSEFFVGDSTSFSVDLDSSSAVLSRVMGENLVDRRLGALKFAIYRAETDTNIRAGFLTEPGRLGNVFVGSDQSVAAIDDAFPVVVKSMIPEIGFGVLLYLIIAGAFYMVYRNLQQERMLRQLKDEFVSNITHELKTPLSIVSVATEALSNDHVLSDHKKSQEYVNITRHEVNRLSGLVDKILNEDNHSDANSEVINVMDTIQKVIRSMQIQSRKINLSGSSDGMYIKMNPSHFNQIIYNLIDNAVKYDNIGNEVKVAARSANEYVEITVSDQGKGIPKPHIDRIFEKFYRIPTFDVHDVKGHGLGLYYVKKHIEEVGGKISVRSDEAGTSFVVLIPAFDEV